MPDIEHEKEQPKFDKSMLVIEKEISNLHDARRKVSAIPGSGRDVILG